MHDDARTNTKTVTACEAGSGRLDCASHAARAVADSRRAGTGVLRRCHAARFNGHHTAPQGMMTTLALLHDKQRKVSLITLKTTWCVRRICWRPGARPAEAASQAVR